MLSMTPMLRVRWSSHPHVSMLPLHGVKLVSLWFNQTLQQPCQSDIATVTQQRIHAHMMKSNGNIGPILRWMVQSILFKGVHKAQTPREFVTSNHLDLQSCLLLFASWPFIVYTMLFTILYVLLLSVIHNLVISLPWNRYYWINRSVSIYGVLTIHIRLKTKSALSKWLQHMRQKNNQLIHLNVHNSNRPKRMRLQHKRHYQ